MTWWHDHPDAAKLASDNWPHAELLLYAQRQPCIRIRNDELERINRVIRITDEDDLHGWSAPRCWMAAVILCKGDNIQALVGAVKDTGLDDSRFHFYLHADCPLQVMQPWAEAGFSLDHVDTGIKDWKSLHKLLGIDFNVQIVNDAVNPAQP